ncbi:hypothetical protein PV336_43040 [Streptomyces sp. MI02-2A]|uniref:hypothetical protein n=1 Tax=unclassified Streptomyces TaxID=2593676 RepID=UPI000E25F876|nr:MULTISPECIES: hypothetical protein [unclassified Streptomyces]MDX3265864.1 hypothetical protein [Streptomyces sp. MI02-2A]REE64000.1 hypothetical protein BX257_6664 [Streptomyces sp. 3212.3]
MISEPTLFLAGEAEPDRTRTGGLDVVADPDFSTASRIQLDATCWVDYVQGWLAGDDVLMRLLMEQAAWEQRSRWMYTRTVEEPRLTAEYPVIADAPQPVLTYLADTLSAHYRRPYTRLWMNWYRCGLPCLAARSPPPWTCPSTRQPGTGADRIAGGT